MRDLINLVEGRLLTEKVNPQGAFFMHVSSGGNTDAILRDGLRQDDFGNYTGYHASLSGIYMTRLPKLILDHIFARGAGANFVLVICSVATPAYIDEDVLDEVLEHALQQAAAKVGRSTQDVVDAYAEKGLGYTALAKRMVPFFRARLGRPTRGQALSPADAVEFCACWIAERMVGENDIEPDWWVDIKTRIVTAYPSLSHPEHGNDYSIRVPAPVGFEGPTKIVAVIEVKDDQPVMRHGALPAAASAMVGAVIDGCKDYFDDDKLVEVKSEADQRVELIDLAVKAHPERTPDEIEDRVGSLDAQKLAQVLADYRSRSRLAAK